MFNQLHDEHLPLDAKRYVTLALASGQEIFHVGQARGPQLGGHGSADDLDGCILAGHAMTSLPYASRGALADRLPQLPWTDVCLTAGGLARGVGGYGDLGIAIGATLLFIRDGRHSVVGGSGKQGGGWVMVSLESPAWLE